MAVTRPRHPTDGGDALAHRLRQVGAEPVHHPLNRVLPSADPDALRRAALRLAGPTPSFDIVLLTSARAVPPLTEALDAVGIDAGEPRRAGVEIWAVGDGTAEAARDAGLGCDRVPDRFVGEALLEQAPEWRDLDGLRVLFPRAAEGRAVLPRGLERKGAVVTLVETYRIAPDHVEGGILAEAAEAGALAAVTLTAGSAARVLAGAWRSRGSAPWPPAVPIVAIGPVTAEAARAGGLPVAAIAEPHTLRGLAACVGALVRRSECGDRPDPAAPRGPPA